MNSFMNKIPLLLFLLLTSATAIYAQTATVHVQDAAAVAIEGATVTLNSTSIDTDSNGDANFSGLADGTYEYTVTADCYTTESGAVVIDGSDNSDTAILSLQTTNDVFVNLVPPGGIGFPPTGVTVRLYNDDLTYDQTLVTGGFTAFQAVPYGTYNYTLSQDCKETVTGTTTVECTPGDIDELVAEFGMNLTTNDVFVNLVPPGGIGFPPTGVTVRLYNDDLTYDQTLVTGGFTAFEAVPYGTYNYTLSQDCKETVTGTTTIECTPGDIDELVAEFGMNLTTNDVFVNLVPPGGIGFPPTGVTVRLYNDDLTYDQTLVTGGFTAFQAVPYGTYNYTLSQDCKETVTGTTTVECTPGDIDELVAEFGMNLNGNDVFFYVGALGQEPDCTITLTNTATSDQTTITGLNTSGDYLFENLPYGTYDYIVTKDCFVSQTGQTTVECQPNDDQGNQQSIEIFLDDLASNTPDNSVTQVDATLTANATGLSYQWILCDGTEIAGETNASFTPTASGDYAVIVTNDNCSATSDCFSVTIVGTSSLSTADLSFYPNPVQDELRIDFDKARKAVEVRIFNINGQLMINKNFSETEMIKLNMSKLVPGTYMLDLNIEGEFIKTPLIKI